MKRTDTHRPSAIQPEEYYFVALGTIKIEHMGDCIAALAEREILKQHMEHTGGKHSQHDHGGNCHVCGAHCVYTAIFHHERTNTYIRTGLDCAEKLWEMDAHRFRKFKEAVQAAEHHRAGKLKAEGYLRELDLSAAWDIYSNHAIGLEEETVRDIVSKLVQYGSLSDKQVGYVRSLLARIPQRAALQAARKAEREAAAPVPVGRQVVDVEVVSVKNHDTDYGCRFVMTVKASQGWLAWGTAPDGIERGAHIRLSATFERSPTDPKFGFFKRPRIVQRHINGGQQ